MPEGFEQAGIYYCSAHAGVANEDSDTCDFYGAEPDAPEDCVLHPCDPKEIVK